MRTGAAFRGTTAGATGTTVGIIAGEGAIVAGGAVMAGAVRLALEGADKLAKSASDSLLSVAR